MKKTFKKIVIIIGVIVCSIFALGIITTISAVIFSDSDEVAENLTEQEDTKVAKEERARDKTWAEMDYFEKEEMLNTILKEREFTNAHDLDMHMREIIKKEIRNPRTVKFDLVPDIYNGTGNVIDADAAWIRVSYRGYAKNDFGVEKDFSGYVMYKCVPGTKDLIVNHWDIYL